VVVSHRERSSGQDTQQNPCRDPRYEGRTGRARERALGDTEKRAIQTWWTTHHEHVQRHVRLDDGLITPFLQTRIAFPNALSARLLACRAALLQAMEPLDAAIGDIIYLTPANLKSSLAEVAALWSRYEAAVAAQLLEAETSSLPLMRAYFGPADVARLNARILDASSALELGGGQSPACLGMRLDMCVRTFSSDADRRLFRRHQTCGL